MRLGLARFERELRSAESGARTDLPKVTAPSGRPGIVELARRGGVKQMAISKDDPSRLRIHLDVLSHIPVRGDRLVALWVEAFADLAAQYRIERVTVGIT